VGFFSTTDEIAACYTRPGASTFGGNPVTARAGLKFLEILQRDRLAARSEQVGGQLKGRLMRLAQKTDIVSNVRGLGLMIGVEIAGRDSLSSAEHTDQILERMKDAGYLLGKTGPGRNVLTWMPPLIVETDELMEAVDTLETVLKTL